MRILLFLPSSQPAYDILSQALYFQKNGYQVLFLSTSPKSEMHQLCNNHQIECDSLMISTLNIRTYFSAASKLANFVKKRKIDLVFSNNLQGNFIAVIASRIHKKRTILTRHHTDYIYTGKNKNAKRQQWFVNRYGKEFIAISDRVKFQMIKEGIDQGKIYRVNLGFDFNLFRLPDQTIVNQLIKDKHSAFKLCIVARLIPLKRHELLLDAILILVNRDINIKLWVVGEGPLLSKLKEKTRYSKIDHVVEFTGQINNPGDYMSASNLLVHISESEASSHVIREASLVNTPVLVCRKVGDFNDYIIDNKNGFFVDLYIDPRDLAEKIILLSTKNKLLKASARELNKTVLEKFDVLTSGKQLLKIIENE